MIHLMQRCLIILTLGIAASLTACVFQKHNAPLQTGEAAASSSELAEITMVKPLPAPIAKQIVDSMNAVDRFKASQALEKMDVGQSTNWANPSSGNQYTVIPNNTLLQDDKRCRNYTLIAVIQTQQYRSQALACRNRHNDWNLLA
ncbi:MAG: surface antigen [Gammaproteobacteria bacterium]|nr:surface antigen [Gammaproteobacteria bacterium]